MGAKVIGAKELLAAVKEMAGLIGDPAVAARLLEPELEAAAPVLTGFLRSSVYHTGNVVGARAPYAGIVADRPGRDYAQDAMNRFPMERYANRIVEPF